MSDHMNRRTFLKTAAAVGIGSTVMTSQATGASGADISIQKGLNMLGTFEKPVTPNTFESAGLAIEEFDRGTFAVVDVEENKFVYKDEVEAGKGYWANITEGGNIELSPIASSYSTQFVGSGGEINLVSVSEPTLVDDLNPNIRLTPWDNYDNKCVRWTGDEYISENIMQPGRGYYVLVNSGGTYDPSSGGSSEYLSGTIEDVNGRPVPNATVLLFAYDHESLSASFELEEIEKTTTSNDGSYTLEQVPVSEFDQYRQSNSITRMLLVAKSEPDTADRRWFDSAVFPPENLPPDGSFSPLRLSHQVIFHEQVSEPLSSVSVWRTIVDSEQNQQTTDIHIGAQGLDGQATTYTQIQNATFSLRVPESLDIEYDSVATGAGWSGETRSDEVLTELAERDTLQNLPVPGVDYSQINSFDADGAAESLSDSRNDFQQSISDAFGFVPYIGTAQGVLTSVTNLLNLDESQIAASIGSGSRYDPNTQDMVNTTVGQKTIAAVSTTRIEISEETEFAARGTWETDSGVIDGPSTPAARLNHEFTVSPSNQGQAISTSTVTTTQQTTSQSQTVQSLPEHEKLPVPAAPTVGQYDQNDDGDISVEELGEAGQDFAADELTIEELAEIGQEFAND